MPFVDKETNTDVIRQIVQRMTLRTEKQQSHMMIKLKPDFLGNVRLHVTTENQQVTVRMEAESMMVKEIIEHNMPHLKAELQHHGLEIDKFDVFVGHDNDESRNGQQQAGFRQGLKRNAKREKVDDLQHENREKDRSASLGDNRTVSKTTSKLEVDYFA
jgi:flagellar hook-length control protein FliK